MTKRKTIIAWTNPTPGLYRSSMGGRFTIRHLGSTWRLEDHVQDIPGDDFTALKRAKRAAQERVTREEDAMAEHRRQADVALNRFSS